MELTRSGADRRLAELKRRRVVTKIDVALSPTQRLTVHVTNLNPATRREVADALADTPWVPELVEAGAKPEPKPAASTVRRMSARARLARLGSQAPMTDAATKPKPPGKLGAEKLTPEEQKHRFIEGAPKAGCSEDEEEFRSALQQVVKPKTK